MGDDLEERVVEREAVTSATVSSPEGWFAPESNTPYVVDGFPEFASYGTISDQSGEAGGIVVYDNNTVIPIPENDTPARVQSKTHYIIGGLDRQVSSGPGLNIPQLDQDDTHASLPFQQSFLQDEGIPTGRRAINERYGLPVEIQMSKADHIGLNGIGRITHNDGRVTFRIDNSDDGAIQPDSAAAVYLSTG